MYKEDAKEILRLCGPYPKCIDKNVLPIMQAFADGKTIQYRWKEGPVGWVTGKNLGFGLDQVEYRIKPESDHVSVVCEGKRIIISRESAKALNLCD